MAPKVVSPIHRVIDAGRWGPKPLLGRLIVLIHAAFLDAGFVPLPLIGPGRNNRGPVLNSGFASLPPHIVPGDGDGPVPREAGRTASALSLRYTAPQLLHRRYKNSAVAVLRQQVYGRKLVLYVQCAGLPVASSWVLVDALDAVSLLSSGLDATAHALRRDARLATLWRGLLHGLCRHALADLCRRNGVALEPTFMSLSDDAKVAILARLTDGADLARVERTCSAMRRLVADHDRLLWKPLYDAIGHSMWYSRVVNDSPEMSWKERYARARRRRLLFWPWRLSRYRPIRVVRITPVLSCYDPLTDLFRLFDPPELPAELVTEPRKWMKEAGAKRDAGRRRVACRGSGGTGGGAVRAPSSRYRWKHR